MASRPIFSPYSVITNGDMSDDIISEVTIIQKLSMLSYSVSWSGSSPVGSISIQVSNDYSKNVDGTVDNAGTWNTLPLSDTTDISGNTGNGFIDIDASAGYALRLLYTSTSGTGEMQVIITGKVA